MTLPAPDACALGIRDETLSAWRDGLAPAAVAQRLEAHVAGCAACGARLGAFDAVRRTLLTQRMPDVQEQVWRALQPRLVSHEPHG